MFVSISESTLKRIRRLKKEGESREDVILRLLDYYDAGVKAATTLGLAWSGEILKEAEG